MKCNNCKNNLAQIPYVEHKKVVFQYMYKAKRLKLWLLVSNIAWAIVAVVLAVR